MVAVPALTPTTDVVIKEPLTVAMAVLLLDHVPDVAGVPLPVSVELPFTQAESVPLTVGDAITLTGMVREQPTLLV